MMDFSRLKDIREDKDINQEKMANILGVKRSTYSLWELGVNIIPLNYLVAYADYFDLSLDYVLNLTNNRKNKNLIKGLNLKTLGKNIKLVRVNNELSQENIAQMLGVSQACIAKYENGNVMISTINLFNFCKEFNIPLNKICGKGKIS